MNHRRSLARVACSMVTAFAVTIGHLVVPSGVAAAQESIELPPEPNPEPYNVTISDVTITKLNERGRAIPGDIHVNDPVRVEFNWQFPKGEKTQPNKFVHFKLPPELQIDEHHHNELVRIKLRRPTPEDQYPDPDHDSIGECGKSDDDPHVFECQTETYNDYQLDRHWSGTLTILAHAAKATTSHELTISANNGAASAIGYYPGTGAGIAPEASLHSGTIEKNARYIDQTIIDWKVGLAEDIVEKQGGTEFAITERFSGYPHTIITEDHSYKWEELGPVLRKYTAEKVGSEYRITNYVPVAEIKPRSIDATPPIEEEINAIGLPDNAPARHATMVFDLPADTHPNATYYYVLQYRTRTANNGWAKENAPTTSVTEVAGATPTSAMTHYVENIRDKGVPSIRVQTSGPEEAKTKDFHFLVVCHILDIGSVTGHAVVKGDGQPVDAVMDFPFEAGVSTGSVCYVRENRKLAEIPGWKLPDVPSRVKQIRLSRFLDRDSEVVFDYNYTQDAPVRAFPVFVKATASGSDNIDGHSYSFEYSCTKDDRVLASSSQKIRVPANTSGTGVKIGEFPEGTSCTVTEDANSIAIPGTRTISPAPGAQLTQRKEVADPHTVFTFDHEYKDPAPQLQISIEATGLHNPAIVKDHKFKVEYSCEIPDGPPYPTGGYLTIVGTNKAVGVPKHFPIGTRCTITEDLDSAQVTGYTLGEVLPATVTITDDTPPVVITNPYSRQLVPVRINHKIVPPTLDTTGKTFRYFFKCTVDGQIEHHTIEVAANQETVTDQKFPIGTECTVTPDPNDNVIPNYNGAPPEPHTFRIDRPNIPTNITLTNVFVPSTPPNNNTPQPPTDDTPQPEKGQPLWWISVIAIPAVIVGLSLLFKHVIATMKKPAPAVEKPVGKKGIPKKPQPAPQPDFKTQVNDFLSGLGLPRI